MKILLVEDNKTERKGIEVFLNSCGYDVVTASDGKEAFELLSIEKMDLIITDIQMPEMNGLELLELLGSNNIQIPTVVITAYATVENAVKAMQEGAEDFLTKPINLNELKLKINKIIRKLNLLDENKNLKYKLEQILNLEIVSISKKMSEVKKHIEKIASDPDVPVLLREGANRAYHEGLGSMMGMAAMQSY